MTLGQVLIKDIQFQIVLRNSIKITYKVEMLNTNQYWKQKKCDTKNTRIKISENTKHGRPGMNGVSTLISKTYVIKLL